MTLYNFSIKRLALLVVCACLFGSCNKDFLDQVPDDIITLQEVFNRRDLSEQYLANVYNYVRDEAHRTNNTPWDVISDDCDVSQRNSPFQVNIGNWNASSNYWNFWVHYYKGIRSATTFINNIDNNQQILEDRAAGPGLIKQYKAEARFLRAFFYFELLKQYGPVILLGDEELPADLPEGDPRMQLPRSSYDECVDYITGELDLAAQDLPLHFTTQPVLDYGRATKIMAMAVKSRMLLYAASPQFNGNPDYAAFKNMDGKALASTTYTAEKWQRAANAAKAIIDIAESQGILALLKKNTSGVYDPLISYRDIFLDPWNVEVIMSRNNNTLNNYERSQTPRLASGYASMGPTQQLIDDYRMANGKRINEQGSEYVENGFSAAAGKYTKVGTYNMYTNREPRFYASVSYSGSYWINTSEGLKEIGMFYTGESGKGGSHDYSETGYMFRKNVHPNSNPRISQYVKRPLLMYRYAEILMNYAEALNEVSPGNADVAKYVNAIRERGGIPALESGLSQTEMRDQIRRERRIEFTMEHLRYFDTRRWKIAEQTDAGPFWGMNVNAGASNSDPAFFKRTVFENRVFRKSFYLFPIPQGEVERNPNLVQNPGW